MTHEERWNLARKVCGRMATQEGKRFVLGGVYGSTARGTDTEWSDLELFFVVEGAGEKSVHFIAEDIPIGYRAVGRETLEYRLTHPSLGWPFLMGMLSVLQVLEGDPSHVQGWLKLGRAVPNERFREALVQALPDLVWESYGRILSSQVRTESHDLLPSVLEVLFEMRTALCLLNALWVTHDYYEGLVDSFSFPKLPAEFPELVGGLWRAKSTDEILELAGHLVANFKQLLADEGIRPLALESMDRLPLDVRHE